jgi:hypothetical protein
MTIETQSPTSKQVANQLGQVIEMMAMNIANIIERLEKLEAKTDGGSIRDYDID